MATLFLPVHQGCLVLSRESEESLLEGDVERADGSLLVVAGPLQVLDGLPVGQSVAGSAVTVVVAVQTSQSLHLLDNLHRVLLYQVLVGQHVVLLGAAVELRAGQDVGDGSESVEQHGHELDDNNGEKEKDENNTNWLQMKVLFCYQNLVVIRDGDVSLDSKWPVDVKNVLVEGQHEHNQHEEGVEHGEKEDGLVPQFLQPLSDLSLLGLVSIKREKIFLNQVFPEADLCSRQIVHLSASQVFVLYPEGVDEVVPLLPVLAGVTGVLLRVHVEALPTLGHGRHGLASQGQSGALPPLLGSGVVRVNHVLNVVQPLGQSVQAVGNPDQLLLVLGLLLVSEGHQAEDVSNGDVDASLLIVSVVSAADQTPDTFSLLLLDLLQRRLLLLLQFLPGAPGDDVEVGDAVYDEEEIHAGDTEQVDHAGHHTPELLRMEAGRYEE